MGYWNETCAITNLPIRYGNPVVAILLEKNPYFNGNNIGIYPDDIWRPVGLPFKGTYDEYGNLEHVTTHPWNQEFLGNTNDASNNLENTDFDTPVIFAHRKVYEELIDVIGKRIVVGTNKTYRDCIYDRILIQIQDAEKPLTENTFRIGHQSCETPQFLYQKYRSSQDEKLKESLLDEITDAQLFYDALFLLRKGYGICCGSGSQSKETALHVLVARLTLDYVKNMYANDPDDNMPPNENGYEEPIYIYL